VWNAEDLWNDDERYDKISRTCGDLSTALWAHGDRTNYCTV